MAPTDLLPSDTIERRILVVRGHKVILDADLAALYGVTTSRLNEQVKRNAARFPADFVFQLSDGEKAEVIAKCDHLSRLRFSPTFPYAFTEHGALMAANVLSSARAVDVSVFVVRAFVRLREALATHKELAKRLEDLEQIVGDHGAAIQDIVVAIRQLMAPPAKRHPWCQTSPYDI
jgi:hypothetical protein